MIPMAVIFFNKWKNLKASKLTEVDRVKLGTSKVARLIFLAEHSKSPLDAYKLALSELESTRNVNLYVKVLDQIRALNPSEIDEMVVNEWISQTRKSNQATLAKLESELRNYKNNLIKESIRVFLAQSDGS
jgi:COP9 signalosome complex subunit 1